MLETYYSNNIIVNIESVNKINNDRDNNNDYDYKIWWSWSWSDNLKWVVIIHVLKDKGIKNNKNVIDKMHNSG